MKNFTELQVWQKSHRLFLDFLGDAQQIRHDRIAYILVEQTIRSLGSIGANIAEGFTSRSTKEYCRYLDISRKSASESENWFYKLRDSGMIEAAVIEQRIASCIEINRMLLGLIKSLKKSTNFKPDQ